VDFSVPLELMSSVVLTATGHSPKASRAGRMWAVSELDPASDPASKARANAVGAAVFWRNMDGVPHGQLPHMPATALYEPQKQRAENLTAVFEAEQQRRHETSVRKQRRRMRQAEADGRRGRMSYHMAAKDEDRDRLIGRQGRREQIEDRLRLPCPRSHAAARSYVTANEGPVAEPDAVLLETGTLPPIEASNAHMTVCTSGADVSTIQLDRPTRTRTMMA